MTSARYLMALTAVMSVATICAAATDDEIRHYLVGSMLYIDNVKGARRDFQRARELCGADTNRFARLLCELAHTNDSWIAGGMIRSLGGYGTSEQLPFLYSQVTNTEYGAESARAILAIEGVTSNSVAMVDRYLSLTNKESRLDRENICKFMLDRFAGPQSPDGIRNVVEQSVLGFAMSNTVYNEYFDESLAQRISGYRYSRRRLDILRRARQIMEISYNESFITNAINELVAYPEADLPD